MTDSAMLPFPEDSSRHRSGKRRSGINGENQRPVIKVLEWAGTGGATSSEIQAALSRGHGQVSGALSTLHKHGHVAMLKALRNKQHIYVLPAFVGDRPTEPRRNVTAHDTVFAAYAAMKDGGHALAEAMLAGYVAACDAKNETDKGDTQ